MRGSTSPRARSLPVVVGVAACGVLVAHWLAYAVAIPPVGERGQILAETGHSYWDLAVKLAVVLVVAGLGSVVAGHFRRSPGEGPLHSVSFLASRLIALQIGVFLAMEVTERLAAGAPLDGLLDGPILVVGLAAQVLVAALSAVLLTWFVRGVERLVEAVRAGRTTLRSRTSTRPRPVLVVARPLRLLAGAAGVRGPPRA